MTTQRHFIALSFKRKSPLRWFYQKLVIPVPDVWMRNALIFYRSSQPMKQYFNHNQEDYHEDENHPHHNREPGSRTDAHLLPVPLASGVRHLGTIPALALLLDLSGPLNQPKSRLTLEIRIIFL